MGATNFEIFLGRVRSEPELQQQITAIQGQNSQEKLEKLMVLAQESGTPFTMEEVLAFDSSRTLSEEELSSINGGVDLAKVGDTIWHYVVDFATNPFKNREFALQ